MSGSSGSSGNGDGGDSAGNSGSGGNSGGNLQAHDPYKGMNTASKDIRPDFLKSTDKNKEKEEKSKNAAKGLGAAEKAAAGGLAGAGGGAEAGAGIAGGLGIGGKGGKGGGLFSGIGRKGLAEKGKNNGKFSAKKVSAAAFVVLGLMLVVVMIGSMGTPLMVLGALDYNLQESVGFSYTTAVLEKQAEYVTGDMMSNGEVPDKYAADLAAAGITVGQVTAKGDFVRTNVYIADADELNQLAAVGTGYHTTGGEGELAALFEGEVTSAEDFVLAVEANPKMYAAFSKAADISARYYYSDIVNEIYSDMNVSRDSFGEWESVGDREKDRERFEELLVQALDKESTTSLAGCRDEDCNESVGVSGVDASEVVNRTSDSSGGTENAAQLLNSALSSEEPYKAVSAFVALEEPAQRLRIDGDGPGVEMIELISETNVVTYRDVNTGEVVEKEASILETGNFAAAVSWGKFSRQEANNFSRDRILLATNTNNKDLIFDTTVESTKGRKSDIAGKSGTGSAESDVMDKAVDSVAIAVTEKNSDLFPSVIGGNRIVEGGSFLSSKINMKALGAMPSDEASIAQYNHEAEEVLARKAEADRATLSPFDISSPNTFLGSIAHGFAISMLRGKTSSNLTSTARAATSLASRSMKGIMGEVWADGEGENFMSTFGDNCSTVSTTAAKTDLYCTQRNTNYTGLMGRGSKYWKEKMGEDEYEDYKNNFVLVGMNRESTVGTKDAEVCKAWKEVNPDLGRDFVEAVSSFFGVYKECDHVDDDVATGSGLTLTDDNKKVKLYSAYTLYDTVSSLLSETNSTAATILKEYRDTHPLDNSAAGIVARRSGMTKEEAQVALNYASYLNMIARYDASDRYAFGVPMEIPMHDALATYSNKLNESIYCFWREKPDYGDVRSQVYLV